MRIAALLFYVTAVLIFFQLVTGGPLALGSVSLANSVADTHVFMGFITGILGLITVVAAWVSKPAYKAFRYITIVMLVLFFLVGFAADKTALNGILVHYELAVLLFGTAIAGTFYAVRWNRMPKPAAAASATTS